MTLAGAAGLYFHQAKFANDFRIGKMHIEILPSHCDAVISSGDERSS